MSLFTSYAISSIIFSFIIYYSLRSFPYSEKDIFGNTAVAIFASLIWPLFLTIGLICCIFEGPYWLIKKLKGKNDTRRS